MVFDKYLIISYISLMCWCISTYLRAKILRLTR